MHKYIKTEVVGITTGTTTASTGDLVVAVPVEVDPVVKKGARNSKNDMARIQATHDHMAELGALCSPGNCPADEGDMEEETTPGRPNPKRQSAGPTKAVDVEGEEASDQAESLGLPLDVLVSAVREAFWELRTEIRMEQKPMGTPNDGYWDWDDDMVPCCVAVYDGYAIARIGLTHYRVEYQVTPTCVELPPFATWTVVTQDWVVKHIPESVMKAFQFREVGAVKSLGGGRIGNYLVVWGDKQNRDLYGEYFTKETEGLKAIFDYIGKVPALYQHAMDGQVKYTPVGVIDTMEVDDVGLWTETQLDLANKYSQAVQQLARKRALGASSGTLPGARKATVDGEIKQWVIIEGSFTPTPAEPRMRELPMDEVKSIYAELNLELPDEVPGMKTAEGGEEPQPVQSADELELEREKLRLLELTS